VPNKKYRIIQLDLSLLYYVQVELPASTEPILPLDAWNHTSIQLSLELNEYNNGNNGLAKAYKPEELMCRYYFLCRYFKLIYRLESTLDNMKPMGPEMRSQSNRSTILSAYRSS